VQGGNWDCVEFTSQFPWWMKPSLCATAASYGHLHILKQLHLRGVPWDKGAPARAAARGQVDCLRYLHENGCPWDENTTNAAARAGQLATLRYAIAHDCPFVKHSVVTNAVGAGSVLCLRYLRAEHRVGLPTIARAVLKGLSAGNVSILEQLLK